MRPQLYAALSQSHAHNNAPPPGGLSTTRRVQNRKLTTEKPATFFFPSSSQGNAARKSKKKRQLSICASSKAGRGQDEPAASPELGRQSTRMQRSRITWRVGTPGESSRALRKKRLNFAGVFHPLPVKQAIGEEKRPLPDSHGRARNN